MIDPANVPPVDDDEMLTRFVTQKGQFRPSNQTLKQDLFIPSPHTELSVTRHRDATSEEIWTVGRNVAAGFARKLYGRGDIRARACRIHPLRVEAKPLSENPNHADIMGWPKAKEEQKQLAMELAAAAGMLISAPQSR